jgi:hypothetical protein
MDTCSTNINLNGQTLHKVSFEEFSSIVAQVTDVNVACDASVGQYPPCGEKIKWDGDSHAATDKEPSRVKDISRFKSISDTPTMGELYSRLDKGQIKL